MKKRSTYLALRSGLPFPFLASSGPTSLRALLLVKPIFKCSRLSFGRKLNINSSFISNKTGLHPTTAEWCDNGRLDHHFPRRWLGRRGPIEWPARSPDLTPPDFSLWGVIKDLVYAKKPRTLQDLRHTIEQNFMTID